MRRFATLSLAMLATSQLLVAADLLPRQVLPKDEKLVAPAYPHELIVKFADEVKARPTVDGDVVSRTGKDIGAVRGVASEHGARFLRLIEVAEEELVRLQNEAAGASGYMQADLAGMMIVDAPRNRLEQVANELNKLDAIEWAYFQEITPPPPCTDIAPVTPNYVAMQGYRGANPGIAMILPMAAGGRGAPVKVADCEYGYNAKHEDLCGIVMEPGQTIHPNVIANGWDEHGTAALGEIIGFDSAYGVTGIAHEAKGYFFTEWSVEQGTRRVTSIVNAVLTVGPGDVVILEMQTTGAGGGFGPAELNPAVWIVSRIATWAGRVVVAAAGNGNQNLDGGAYWLYQLFGDSGAIIVGAGTADANHDKMGFSSYGNRVNLQGWGEKVFTLGYGDFAQHGGDKNQRYTNTFSGTSSATPIVAGAATVVQSLSWLRTGAYKTPAQVRQLLIDTGTPQGAGGHIGPLPHIIRAGATIPLPGDLNCDGVVQFDDINPFVLALSDPQTYENTFPDCRILNADANEDGQADFGDVNAFVEILSEV
jgi:subtilisin family serine protease